MRGATQHRSWFDLHGVRSAQQPGGGYNINPRLGVAVAASCEGPTRHRSMVFAPDTQTWRGEPEKNDDDDIYIYIYIYTDVYL